MLGFKLRTNGNRNVFNWLVTPALAAVFGLVIASCSGGKKNSSSNEGSIGVSLFPPSTSNLTNDADSVGNFNSIDVTNIDTVIPVHIGFKAESPGGRVFQTDLTSADEANISLPFGRVKVTVSYLAMGTSGATLQNICDAKKSNSNSSPQTVMLYSEYTNVFNIDSSTNQLYISFTNPFNLVAPEDKFGFTFRDSNNQPVKAKISYIDPTSGMAIKDPCNNNEFTDESNDKGRLAVNFPLYTPNRSMMFKVQAGDTTYRVNAQLDRARLNPAFYTFRLANPESTVSPTPDTESFTENNLSIKDALAQKINPRYPLIKYELATPFFDQQGQLFIPFFRNVSDAGNDRKLNVACRIISSNASDVNYSRFANFINCTSINPFPKVTPGATYRITAYLQDSEGFIASNQATNTLVIPASTTTTPPPTNIVANTIVPNVIVSGVPTVITTSGISNLFNGVIYTPSQNLTITLTGGLTTSMYNWALNSNNAACNTVTNYATWALLNVPLNISSSLNNQGSKRLCIAIRHTQDGAITYMNYDWFVETRSPSAIISGQPTTSYSGSLGVNIVIGSNTFTNAPISHYFYSYFSTPSAPSSTACPTVTLSGGTNIGVNGSIGTNWIGPIGVNTLITSQMSPTAAQNRALCVRGVSPTGVVQPTPSFVSWPTP